MEGLAGAQAGLGGVERVCLGLLQARQRRERKTAPLCTLFPLAPSYGVATATAAAAAGSWELLTGTTGAAGDTGVMEFFVDCDGTTGWVNVDDWSI